MDALAKVQYPVIRSTPFDAKPADLIRAAKELELEGIIAKRKDSLYEPGRRSGAWLKYKINRSQEFVIGGYTAGNPFDALIVGVYDGADAQFCRPRSRMDLCRTFAAKFSRVYAAWKLSDVRSPIFLRSGARCGR